MLFRRCKALPKPQRRHVRLSYPQLFAHFTYPFSSRLNTFLELKTENERLQKRLAELRGHASSPPAPISGPSTSPAYSFRSSSVSRSSAPSVSLCSPDVPSAHYSQHLARRSFDNFGSSRSHVQGSAYESHGLHTYNGQYSSASIAQPVDDDLSDETLRRKRVR